MNMNWDREAGIGHLLGKVLAIVTSIAVAVILSFLVYHSSMILQQQQAQPKATFKVASTQTATF